MEALTEIVKQCCDLKIQVLTVYGFSTENWKRPREEINSIIWLVVDSLNREIEEMCKNGVRINPIGRLEELPEDVQAALSMSAGQSRNNHRLILNVALNYHCYRYVWPLVAFGSYLKYPGS